MYSHSKKLGFAVMAAAIAAIGAAACTSSTTSDNSGSLQQATDQSDAGSCCKINGIRYIPTPNGLFTVDAPYGSMPSFTIGGGNVLWTVNPSTSQQMPYELCGDGGAPDSNGNCLPSPAAGPAIPQVAPDACIWNGAVNTTTANGQQFSGTQGGVCACDSNYNPYMPIDYVSNLDADGGATDASALIKVLTCVPCPDPNYQQVCNLSNPNYVPPPVDAGTDANRTFSNGDQECVFNGEPYAVSCHQLYSLDGNIETPVTLPVTYVIASDVDHDSHGHTRARDPITEYTFVVNASGGTQVEDLLHFGHQWFLVSGGALTPTWNLFTNPPILTPDLDNDGDIGGAPACNSTRSNLPCFVTFVDSFGNTKNGTQLPAQSFDFVVQGETVYQLVNGQQVAQPLLNDDWLRCNATPTYEGDRLIDGIPNGCPRHAPRQYLFNPRHDHPCDVGGQDFAVRYGDLFSVSNGYLTDFDLENATIYIGPDGNQYQVIHGQVYSHDPVAQINAPAAMSVSQLFAMNPEPTLNGVQLVNGIPISCLPTCALTDEARFVEEPNGSKQWDLFAPSGPGHTFEDTALTVPGGDGAVCQNSNSDQCTLGIQSCSNTVVDGVVEGRTCSVKYLVIRGKLFDVVNDGDDQRLVYAGRSSRYACGDIDGWYGDNDSDFWGHFNQNP